jgi:hypothetical protein
MKNNLGVDFNPLTGNVSARRNFEVVGQNFTDKKAFMKALDKVW